MSDIGYPANLRTLDQGPEPTCPSRPFAARSWQDHVRGEAAQGTPDYSFRLSRKARGVGYRDDDFLRVVSLHPDHDSATAPTAAEARSRAG